jgi:hypothetical protein
MRRAVAYLHALALDRKAALALSEQKTEEAKLIEARQEHGAPLQSCDSYAAEPKVRRLFTGGRWIRTASPFCGGLRRGFDRGDAFPSSTIYDGAFTSSAEADAQCGLGQR